MFVRDRFLMVYLQFLTFWCIGNSNNNIVVLKESNKNESQEEYFSYGSESEGSVSEDNTKEMEVDFSKIL